MNISHENILLIVSILLSLIFLFISFRLKISNVFIVIIFFFSSLSFSYSVDFVFKEVLSEHHRNRINDVLGIKSDPQGAGYNVKQSKIAIGSGGCNGKGYLQGTQTKYNFVPEQDTDFIFCTVGEEWGFIGTSIVMSLFFIFILRLILLAERQHNKFNRTFGYGIIF
ncbi:MAG: rod shape-determining protein RodA, partial [Bacteroidetes bacterium 4572_128]